MKAGSVSPGPELLLSRGERVMVLAPHPDDESLVAGGLLQRARGAGGAARVVFATDGENNPWTQRLVERRLRIGPDDRARFGRLRRAEALAALSCLGLKPEDAVFLGLPDQGLTDLLLKESEPALAVLFAAIASWRPTLLVIPSPYDLHADHSALAVLARLALTRLDPDLMPRMVLGYIVHARDPRPDAREAVQLRLLEKERGRKREAIRRYATQLAVHPRKFLAFAPDVEVFVREPEPPSGLGGPGAGDWLAPGARHPVRSASIERGTLRLDLALRPRPGAFGPATLLLAVVGERGGREGFTMPLAWRARAAPVRRVRDGAIVGKARLEGGRRGGVLRLPLPALAPAARLFLKVRRAIGFFDEAGWIEVRVTGRRPASAAPAPETPARAEPVVCCVVPCYNVASLCGDVVRGVLGHAARAIVVDDGSTDGTRAVLEEIAGASGGRVEVLAFDTNRGKGAALLQAFRSALEGPRFDVLVTIDGDGQHRPEDIPRLVASCRDGADLVIGERSQFLTMPLRSRIGNTLITTVLRRLDPDCPADTQSGLRALGRGFVEDVVRSVSGHRYEAETNMILLALARRRRIAGVPIPTIYLDGNRSSHFRPLADSARIGIAVLKWLLSGSFRRRFAAVDAAPDDAPLDVPPIDEVRPARPTSR